MNIAQSIGNTPLVELKHVVPNGCGRIFIKLEGQNPSGSMKDRMAYAVVRGALDAAKITSTGTLVEYTGGSTGTSLATVCASESIKLTIVTSDAFSLEKRIHMRSLGAHVIEIKSDHGRTTSELIRRMIDEATKIAGQPDFHLVDQFQNPHAAKGYEPLADELTQQLPADLDVFVQSVGTAQCIKGVGARLRQMKDAPRIVAVEPAESPVLSGGDSGPHKIEGVGPGFIPPIWEDGMADDIQLVTTSDSMEMARRLACEEGIFAGSSSGANVAAAIRVAQQLGPESIVATIACDTGLKYVSTALYSDLSDEQS